MSDVTLEIGTPQISFATHASLVAAAANVMEVGTPTEVELSLLNLADAAARLREDGNAPTGVSDLLSRLASVVGTGDGQSVAEIAHQIRDTVERGRPQVPGGPPTEPPGRPDGLPGRGPGS